MSRRECTIFEYFKYQLKIKITSENERQPIPEPEGASVHRSSDEEEMEIQLADETARRAESVSGSFSFDDSDIHIFHVGIGECLALSSSVIVFKKNKSPFACLRIVSSATRDPVTFPIHPFSRRPFFFILYFLLSNN